MKRTDVITVYALEYEDGELWGPSSGAAGKNPGRWFSSLTAAKREAKRNGGRWGSKVTGVVAGYITWEPSEELLEK